MLGLLPVGLAFLRAVDAVEADALSLVVVQDFYSFAVDDAGDRAGNVSVRFYA